MKKVISLIAVFIFLAGNIFSQDLRKKAEENPLDCALFLLSKDKDLAFGENLTRNFFETGRYDDALLTISFDESNSSKFSNFSYYGNKLIALHKAKKADIFLAKAISVLCNEEDWTEYRNLDEFVFDLIELDHLDKTLEIAAHEENNGNKAKLLTSIAAALIKKGQSEKTAEILPDALKLAQESENSEILLSIATVYAKLKQADQAKNILSLIDRSSYSDEPDDRQDRFFPILSVYLELGNIDKAFEIWNGDEDHKGIYDYSKFIGNLISHEHQEKCLPLILQMASDKEQFERDGNKVVEAYLKLGDVNSAVFAAKSMSVDDDNFWQQNAFITLADYFISEGRNEAATEILTFAFQRAKKIIYAHSSEQSVGASSGSRKSIYLGQIYTRFIKLKRFHTAFKVFNSINSKQLLAQEFVAEHLVDFAKNNMKNLSRKQVLDFFAKAQNLIKEDDDYHSIYIKLRIAEAYVPMGEKDQAVQLIAEAIKAAHESCCYQDDFLLLSGKIFEQNNLKANSKLRSVLKQIIENS